MNINYLDLFSGIGGFTLGLQYAGFPLGWHGFSEIDPYAEQIYMKHFPNAERLGNVAEINTSKLPKIDLITFGFPCQDLSIAGKRGGLQASRSGLFFEATRIIDDVRPDYFIFENVKGLLSSNDGSDFIIILQEISDIGYDGQWQLLNTRWFLPQNRERIYFVGHIRGKSRPKIFPIGDNFEEFRKESSTELDTAHIQQRAHGFNKGGYKKYPNLRAKGDSNHNEYLAVEEPYACSALDANYHKGPSKGYGGKGRQLIQVGNVDTQGHNSLWGRVYDPDGISATINAEGGGMGAKTGLYKIEKLSDYQGDKVHQEDGVVSTIPAQGGNKLGGVGLQQKDYKIRRLTPLECERLQGFPDNWTDGISDTQRYKCIGNAVSVPVVYEIALRLKGYLK